MCKVNLDLSNDSNLRFAVYNLILKSRDEFDIDGLVQTLESYQQTQDPNALKGKIKSFLNRWVDDGVIQEHWNTFSLI